MSTLKDGNDYAKEENEEEEKETEVEASEDPWLPAPTAAIGDFLLSIGQQKTGEQCDALSVECRELSAARYRLLADVLEPALARYASLAEWLPRASMLAQSRHVRLLEWTRELLATAIAAAASQNSPSSSSSSMEVFRRVCLEYTRDYNTAFRLTHGSAAAAECSSEQLFSTCSGSIGGSGGGGELSRAKHLSLKMHAIGLERRLVDLHMRKSYAEREHQAVGGVGDSGAVSLFVELMNAGVADVAALSVEQQLRVRSDLIESSVIAYAASEMEQLQQQQQQQQQYQLVEAFRFVMWQFLDDNMHKWLMMESALLEAAKHAPHAYAMLTSMDGSWYLDEMVSLVLNCDNLVRLVDKCEASMNTNTNNASEEQSARLARRLHMCSSLAALFVAIKQLLDDYNGRLFAALVKSACNEVASSATAVGSGGELNAVRDQLDAADVDGFFQLVDSVDTNDHTQLAALLSVRFLHSNTYMARSHYKGAQKTLF